MTKPGDGGLHHLDLIVRHLPLRVLDMRLRPSRFIRLAIPCEQAISQPKTAGLDRLTSEIRDDNRIFLSELPSELMPYAEFVIRRRTRCLGERRTDCEV